MRLVEVNWVLRCLRLIYLATKGVLLRIPGGPWLLAWTDPLHLARRLLRQAIKEHSHYAQGSLLDIGCGGKPYRDLFQFVDRYIGLDIPSGGKVDVIGDAMRLPFRSQVFDTVLCNEVLEHVPEPSVVMAEAAQVLKPGGYLLLTTPQTWGLHLEPYDFYRYTHYGLRYLAEKNGLEVIEVIPTCGLWATLTQRMVDTIIHTYVIHRPPWVILALSILLSPVLLTGFILDKLFGKQGDTLDNVLIARKPELVFKQD